MLNGKTVKLRALEPSDVDLLFDWENDFCLWKVSGTLKPFSRNLIKEYVESEEMDIFQTKQLRMMIEKVAEAETVGIIDLFDFDPYNSRAGVGIMIHKSFRNKGFASEALELMCNYSFNYLGIHQLYCDIAQNNQESLKLFDNAGFVRVGTKKAWIFNGKNYENVIFFQKIKPE